jgi:chromosome segregation ATPase
MSDRTPAEHAAVVRAALHVLQRVAGRYSDFPEADASLAALVALAERATELERGRMDLIGTAADYKERAEQLERDREHWFQNCTDATARIEQLERELAEEREEHSATRESVRGEREFRELQGKRIEQLETVLRVLLADDEMQDHWDDCPCSYCRAILACRAALGETEGGGPN